MKFIDEYQNGELARSLARRIASHSTRRISLMEFCGGHTHAVLRHGIRQLVPDTVEMRSGPGCPVCVTATTDIDRAIALAHLPRAITATFGDIIRVPGSHSSLQHTRAEGADIRVAYSTTDALAMARANPDRSVIFIAIGFETTAPTIAASIAKAREEEIDNFYVLSLLKLTPPVMRALLDLGEVKLDGIVGPGHVSVVIGARPYEFIPRDYGVACVISGFEPLDILLAIDRLVEQVESHQPRVEIAYSRGVRPEGNTSALKLMNEVFEADTANWRGIGSIPESGLKIRDRYASFDAARAFSVSPEPVREPRGCICGDVLRGVATPPQCKLFGQACTPERPVGPCMVSSEGACAAYYQFAGVESLETGS